MSLNFRKKHSFFLFSILVNSLAAQNATLDSILPLTHGTFLDAEKTVHLAWRYNETHVDVEMSAPTLGWIAMGISPNGGMDQSDVLLAWVDDNSGTATVQDRWNSVDSSRKVNLSLDGQQDWTLVQGTQNATHTTVRAVRAADTCDARDRPFTPDTLRIIYAYHTKDPTDVETITKHRERGTRSILLYSPTFLLNRTEVLTTEQNLHQMEIRVDRVNIPRDLDTLYYCKLIRLPKINRKFHIIGVKPLIDRGNEKLVHHIVVYLCNDNITDRTEPKEFSCTSHNNASTNSIAASCSSVLAVWAVGGNDFYFPEDAGLPLTPELSGRYVFIENHYNNPNPPSGSQTDSSGVGFILTERLRRFDAATMSTGVMDFNYLLTIPPNVEDFVVHGHCQSNCTQSMFPPDGIHIFQALLHTHLRGRKIFLRHIRDGKELALIASDENFDFSYQEARLFNPPRTVLPGDQMVVDCHYNTAGKSTPTFGGFSTQDEMCLVYITYYPATILDSCGSMINQTKLMQQINYPLDTERFDQGEAESESTAASIRSYLSEKYEWSPANTAGLQEFYSTAAYMAICGADQKTFVVPSAATQNYSTFIEPSRCARTGSSRGLQSLSATADSVGSVQSVHSKEEKKPSIHSLTGGSNSIPFHSYHCLLAVFALIKRHL